MNRIPWPLNDGGAIGAYHFVKGYAGAGCEVHCLAMNTSKHYVDLRDTGDAFAGVKKMLPIPVYNHIRPLPALLNLFAGGSYVIERFKSKAYEQALITLLKEHTYDVVHVDGLPPCLYIRTVRQHSPALIVQRAHNVEYKIWQRAAEADRNPLKRWYLRIQASRLKAFEKAALGMVDLVLAISKEDEQFIQQLQPAAKTMIVPAGMDIDETMPVRQPEGLRLFFIGALDWIPNRQGLEWFLADVWPRLHEAFPDMDFHIAGKKMPAQFHDYAAMKVVAHGEVPSSEAFMQQYSVLVSPLLSGSGVRIKIIEAMAKGKVILSTTVSAEGSGAADGRHLLIADNADDFIRQIRRLREEPGLLEAISQQAHAFAVENFQNKKVMGRLVGHYGQICK